MKAARMGTMDRMTTIAHAIEADDERARLGAMIALAPRIGRILGLRLPVYIARMDAKRSHGMPTKAVYRGDETGRHEIAVDLNWCRGVGALYTIGHELTHALQAERAGSWPLLLIAYDRELKTARKRGATQREAYLQLSYEQEARRMGAEIAATIAAEMEDA